MKDKLPAMEGNSDGIDWFREAREHAWNWFSLHANQRMQSLYYFLIAVAFLSAAYVGALTRADIVAVSIAFVGLLLTFAFRRLELRSRELIHLGESALRKIEQEMTNKSQNPTRQGGRLVAASTRSHVPMGHSRDSVFGGSWFRCRRSVCVSSANRPDLMLVSARRSRTTFLGHRFLGPCLTCFIRRSSVAGDVLLWIDSWHVRLPEERHVHRRIAPGGSQPQAIGTSRKKSSDGPRLPAARSISPRDGGNRVPRIPALYRGAGWPFTRRYSGLRKLVLLR